MRTLLVTALALASASCITVAIPPADPGGGTTGVSQRTGVSCKEKAGVGHSCTNFSHTCADLAADMLACCGSYADVSSARCTFAVQ